MSISNITLVQCDGPTCSGFTIGQTAGAARRVVKDSWFEVGSRTSDFCSQRCHDDWLAGVQARVAAREAAEAVKA